MRILLTTDTVGGVWTFTRALASELLRRDHTVGLASFGRAPSADQSAWCNRMMSESSNFVFQAFELPLEWMPENDRVYDAGLSLLLPMVDKFHPNVVHSSQFCFGSLPLDLPVVVTAHSDVMSWGAACRPGGLDESAWLTRYCGLVERGLAGASAVVAPTHWMLSALQENFEVAGTSQVIGNGLSLAAYEGGPRLLQAVSAGRLWDEGKNLSLLTKVVSTIPIVVAGEREYLSTGALLETGGVTMLGALGEEALLALFRKSAMYVAPSVYEPFGLAPLEAALCGCALLLNDIPSLREVWGESALYFSGATGLEALLESVGRGELKLEDAQAGVMMRARRMTAQRMTDSYVELYEAVTQEATMSGIETIQYVQ